MKAAGSNLSWWIVLSPVAVIPLTLAFLFSIGLAAVIVKWAIGKADNTLRD